MLRTPIAGKWDYAPNLLRLCLQNAPLKHRIYLVGVLTVVIISFTSRISDLIKVHDALDNITCPFLRSIGHALGIFPQHYKSIRIANESRTPIRCSHIVIATFLKMCIRSSKWLILMSSQCGNSKNIDNLHTHHTKIRV
jgi:hypothetical protein